MVDICPYRGEAASVLSDEHIFPHALGGGLNYSIRVSKRANDELGDTLDAALMSSPLIQILRLRYGVRSRSGEPEWRVRARLMPENVDADLVFKSNGSLEQRILKPVKSIDQKGGELILGPDQVEKFLDQFIDGQKKRGRETKITAHLPQSNSYYIIDISLDLHMLQRSMCKIAFAALFEYLGNKFLDDPLVTEWRKVLFSQDRSAIEKSRIRGRGFLSSQHVGLLIPDLLPHEHGIAIVNLYENLPVCCVSLFGTEFHNLLAVASETSNLGVAPLNGIVVICDAKTRKITRKDFSTEILPKVVSNLDRKPYLS